MAEHGPEAAPLAVQCGVGLAHFPPCRGDEWLPIARPSAGAPVIDGAPPSAGPGPAGLCTCRVFSRLAGNFGPAEWSWRHHPAAVDKVHSKQAWPIVAPAVPACWPAAALAHGTTRQPARQS